jgi:hypothetical protein
MMLGVAFDGAATTSKDVSTISWTGVYLGVQPGHAWGAANFDDDNGLTVRWPHHEWSFGLQFAAESLGVGVEGDPTVATAMAPIIWAAA